MTERSNILCFSRPCYEILSSEQICSFFVPVSGCFPIDADDYVFFMKSSCSKHPKKIRQVIYLDSITYSHYFQFCHIFRMSLLFFVFVCCEAKYPHREMNHSKTEIPQNIQSFPVLLIRFLSSRSLRWLIR